MSEFGYDAELGALQIVARDTVRELLRELDRINAPQRRADVLAAAQLVDAALCGMRKVGRAVDMHNEVRKATR